MSQDPKVSAMTVVNASSPQISDVAETTETPRKNMRDLKNMLQAVLICIVLQLFLLWIIGKEELKSARDERSSLVAADYREHDEQSTKEKLRNALIIGGVIMTVIIVMTFLMLLIFYMHWEKIFFKIFTGLLLMSIVVNGLFIATLIVSTNDVVVDIITVVLFAYNMAVVVTISLIWMAPKLVQQMSLILICNITAFLINYLLYNTMTWILVGFLIVWDLIAVLCPFGPLKLMVNIVDRSGGKLPNVLIYHTIIMRGMKLTKSASRRKLGNFNNNNKFPQFETDTTIEETSFSEEKTETKMCLLECRNRNFHNKNRLPVNVSASTNGKGSATEFDAQSMATNENTSNEVSNDASGDETTYLKVPAIRPTKSSRLSIFADQDQLQDYMDEIENEYESTGSQLGLGDFIFYSLMVGKAYGYGNWISTIAVLISILSGLVLTVMILFLTNIRALPALPISCTLGLIVFLLSHYTLEPMIEMLNDKQLFV
ncbi:hypothetical protein SNEBB_007172 [Seison nebaliae]|nr:hypothetical protein SNEBB_007172 [Seison nebaliae]